MNGSQQPKADWRSLLAQGWQIREFLKRYRRIAVIGMPSNDSSEAMTRARRLLAYDFELFPVHTDCKAPLGHACTSHLHAIPGEIDIVLVLPTSEVSLLHVATEAIQKRVRVFWVEDAAIDHDVATLLMQAGVQVVDQKSLEVEFSKLSA